MPITLEDAQKVIKKYLSRLNKDYTREVFDEYAILSLQAGGKVLHYSGPRENEFNSELGDDLIHLRKEIVSEQPEHGEFGFTRDGAGTYYDAFICLGQDLFAVFNNTQKSMQEITQDPMWLIAQSTFLELSQKFTRKPVELVGE